MNYILRSFFYSLGLAMLFAASALNPATAQFKDFLMVLHSTVFWQVVGLVAITLAGADLVFTGTYCKAIEVMFNVVERLRNSGENKTAR